MSLTTMPTQLVAGDSLALSLEGVAASYPASAGWGLRLVLTPIGGGTPVEATGAGGATAWDFTILPAASSALVAGDHRWAVVASKTGERATVLSGTLAVLPDPTDGGDLRSAAERGLAAIDAVLEGRAGSADLKYVFEDGRSIERLPHSELLRLRAHYAARVVREKRGRRGPGRVLTRL